MRLTGFFSVAMAITTGSANWSIWTSCVMPGLRIGSHACRIAMSVFSLTWEKLRGSPGFERG